MAKILDCTTRDGGHTTNWNFDDEFVYDLMNKLNDSGIKYYEIGYRNRLDTEGKGEFYTCKPEFIKKFHKKKGNLELGVMVDEKRYSEEDFISAQNDYADFVRVACHPDKISNALEIVNTLFARGYRVFLQIMDISNIDELGYAQLFAFERKDELISLYLADSYGTLSPDEVERYINKLKTLGYKKISFHGHNNGNLAFENSIRAVKCGAFSIDTTLNGIGRCGGNLDLDKFLNAQFSVCSEAS